jgi:hypothetical protein
MATDREPRHVLLYTRRLCSLCEEARAILHHLSNFHPFLLEEVDVDADPALAARYGDSVPVAVMGGRELFRLRADVDELRRALGGA